jgi:hypothetical protein
MVVAIFRGRKFNVTKVSIDSIVRSEGLIRIRLGDVSYQTVGHSDSKQSYAFVVLAKSNDSVVVEQNVQQYKGQPPKWAEWRRTQASDSDRQHK